MVYSGTGSIRCVASVDSEPQMAQVSEDTSPISDANVEETQIVLIQMNVVLI